VLSGLMSDYSTVVVVIALALFFGLTSARFLSPANIGNILRQMAIVGVLAIGMTMVILIGGIDLSVGSVVLVSGAIAGTLILNYQFNAWCAIAVALLAGASIGLVNGILIERAGISSVIVTLGTLIAVRGMGQAILWLNNSWV